MSQQGLNVIQKCFMNGSNNANCCEKIADVILCPVSCMWSEYMNDGTKVDNMGEVCLSMVMIGCPLAELITVPIVLSIYILISILLLPLLIVGGSIKSCVLYCDDDAQTYNIEVTNKIIQKNSCYV